jgi:predicted DNA-binding WGR domain protein
MLQQTDIELTSVDPARRRARRYRLTTFRSLFGSPALLISWGRIGQLPRVRIETFTSEAELEARHAELLARRHAHGYTAQGAAPARAA